MTSQPEPSLIEDTEQFKPLRFASTGQRFANYIIDIIAFYIIAAVINTILVIITAWTAGSDFFHFMFSRDHNTMILRILYTVTEFMLLYFSTETVFSGKTLGKLVTGTKAVRTDHAPFTWKDALMRSLCRCIPFEPLSAFCGGFWHDRFTKTGVIKIK